MVSFIITLVSLSKVTHSVLLLLLKPWCHFSSDLVSRFPLIYVRTTAAVLALPSCLREIYQRQ
jgi:hypothetical protein